MSTNRFHKAAKDGIIDVLKETTKRDCNSRDEQRMTPTLYAAFFGNLEALRVLCGRGGDPDKADLYGNTALHLAAAQGHKHIVTFLVNFGVNIYSTNIDGRSAQELAGINNREDILRFIDGVHAKLEATDKKKAKAMQEKAREDAKKRNKKRSKLEQMTDKLERKKSNPHHRPSMMETLRSRISGGSMSNLSTSTPERRLTYSAIISGGTMTGKGTMTSLQRKIQANKNNRLGQIDDDFKISGIEDGKRTVNSIKGIRRDSEVLYGGTFEGSQFHRRGRLDGVFNEAEHADAINDEPPPPGRLARSKSQPDFLQDVGKFGDDSNREPASIFVRPGMGSIVIRKTLNNTFSGFYGTQKESSIGSGESYGPRQTTDDELTDSESSEEEENPKTSIERFLTACGLSEYLPKFLEQKIDLDTLLILTESDLKTLKLPLGPYRILVNTINERKMALENPGEIRDSVV